MSDGTATLLLAELQQWLQRAVMRPGSVESARAAPGGIPTNALVRGGRASAEERLQVYASGYLSRLEECLAADYGALKYAFGDEAFSRLCADYVERYPSTHPSLNGFGARLPNFLSDKPCHLGPFAVDLARLEWAIVEVLHSKSSEGFAMSQTLGSLSQESLESVRFVPNDAVRLLFSGYPVSAFLQDFLDGREPPIPVPSPCATLVVRSGYCMRRLDLEPAQLKVLQPLLAGEPLGMALAGTDASEATVGTWFQAWTEAGVFASAVASLGVGACN